MYPTVLKKSITLSCIRYVVLAITTIVFYVETSDTKGTVVTPLNGKQLRLLAVCKPVSCLYSSLSMTGQAISLKYLSNIVNDSMC